MSTTKKTTDIKPDAIWKVIANAQSYKDWVVGAKEVRDVTGNWPEVGSEIHHTVGVDDVGNKDVTVVLEAEENRHIKLKAHFRPLGVAEVTIDLIETATGTEIVMEEVMVDGAASHIPQVVNDVGLHPRNVKTLDLLAELAHQLA
jgi:hypothetical protein